MLACAGVDPKLISVSIMLGASSAFMVRGGASWVSAPECMHIRVCGFKTVWNNAYVHKLQISAVLACVFLCVSGKAGIGASYACLAGKLRSAWRIHGIGQCWPYTYGSCCNMCSHGACSIHAEPLWLSMQPDGVWCRKLPDHRICQVWDWSQENGIKVRKALQSSRREERGK
eukprot:1161125-Pelagomonas_calceolata.AAC.12